jgi:hypothetical protein
VKAQPHGWRCDEKFQNLRSAVFFVRIRQMRGALAPGLFSQIQFQKAAFAVSVCNTLSCARSPLSRWQLYLRVSAHILYIPASATIYCGREEVISHAVRAPPPLPSRMMKFYEVAAVK